MIMSYRHRMPPSGGIVESRHDQRWEEMAFLLNSMTVVAMERSLRQKQFPPPLGTGLALLLILITKKHKMIFNLRTLCFVEDRLFMGDIDGIREYPTTPLTIKLPIYFYPIYPSFIGDISTKIPLQPAFDWLTIFD